MKRVMIACIILCLLAAGCFFGHSTINRITVASLSTVSDAIQAAEKNNALGAYSSLSRGQQYWSDSRAALGALIDHGLIDQVELLFCRALRYSESAEFKNLLPELAELCVVLECIRTAESLSIENIL